MIDEPFIFQNSRTNRIFSKVDTTFSKDNNINIKIETQSFINPENAHWVLIFLKKKYTQFFTNVWVKTL